MDGLDGKIEVIRESGIGLGLSDIEIDLCMLTAMKELHKTQEDAKKKTQGDSPAKGGTRSKSYRVARVMCMIGLALMVLGGCATVVLYTSTSVQRWLEKRIDSLVYPATTYWRLATLRITKTFDLSNIYESECIINNPLLQVEYTECEDCARITKVHELNEITSKHFEDMYWAKSQPLVLRGTHPNVSYADLQVWYQTYGATLDHSSSKLTTAPYGTPTIGDLFGNFNEQSIQSKKNFHAEWTSKTVNPSRILRKVFPRQSFVPAKAEVNLYKVLIVTSPDKDQFSMNDGNAMPSQWYVQGSGSRKITLNPMPSCTKECREQDVIMRPGDVLVFTSMFWKVTSSPVTDSEDVNVAFIGSFSFI